MALTAKPAARAEGGRLTVGEARELAAAAAVLGTAGTRLLDYPDGALSGIPLSQLAGHVHQQVEATGPEALLVFDEGGITGHPDHRQATAAALAAAAHGDLTVIAWAIPTTSPRPSTPSSQPRAPAGPRPSST